MWQGRVAEDLGHLQTALDIYDEVLRQARRSGSKNRPRAWSLSSPSRALPADDLAEQAPKEFLSEASTWLKDYQRLKPRTATKGVALEIWPSAVRARREEIESEKTKRLANSGVRRHMTRVRSRINRNWFCCGWKS